MVISGTLTGFGVLYPAMVREEGWTASQVTGAFSVAQLVYAPVAVSTGFLVDRFGVRRVMLLGCLLLGLGLAWLSRAGSLWEVHAAWGLAAGLGLAGAGVVPVAKLLSLRAGRRFARVFGITVAGLGIGSFVSAPALAWIVDASGWRAAAAALGATIVLLLVPLVLWGTAGLRVDEPSGGADSGRFARLVRRSGFWLLFCANVGIGFLVLLQAHLVAHLLQVGFPMATAATVAGVMGLLQAGGAASAGWWIDRWGAPRVQVAAAALFALGMLALLGSGPETPWLIAAFLLVGAPGRGAVGVGVTAVSRQLFGGPSFGRVTGTMEIAFGTGSFAGPWISALLREQTGGYAPGLASAALAAAVVAACTVLAARRRAEAGH